MENFNVNQIMEGEVSELKPAIEAAQRTAKQLLEQNRGNPVACAEIETRLDAARAPLSNAMSSIEERQKKLERINKAIDKYEEEKLVIEELLVESKSEIDEIEPFGSDLEKGEEQVKIMEVKCFLYLVLIIHLWSPCNLLEFSLLCSLITSPIVFLNADTKVAASYEITPKKSITAANMPMRIIVLPMPRKFVLILEQLQTKSLRTGLCVFLTKLVYRIISESMKQ